MFSKTKRIIDITFLMACHFEMNLGQLFMLITAILMNWLVFAQDLKKIARVAYDETQSIGKRYRRQDEIGTPFCVTVDFETLEDGAVTVRDRDTMKQERVPVSELASYIAAKIAA
jgi:glycyl-tRNA synthetase (class II)